MHSRCIMCIRMKNSNNGGYLMLKRLKIMLTVGCMTLCTVSGVQAATLEDSMLQPPSSVKCQSDREHNENTAKKASSFSTKNTSVTTAAELVDLSQEARVDKIGEMCREDYEKSGVLASVSAAQCILESGYLTTELATDANNCFGMKANLSGNAWEGSTWDGTSLYTKQTGEEYNGKNVTIVADFRRYDCVEDSVADHSAYLLGATVDGETLRYAGLEGETDYKKAIQIIKDGGYATDSGYVEKVCSIIERYDLTRFDDISGEDTKEEDKKTAQTQTQTKAESSLYRVRKSWDDAASQIGAFSSLENAREACAEGYHIYDCQGNAVE